MRTAGDRLDEQGISQGRTGDGTLIAALGQCSITGGIHADVFNSRLIELGSYRRPGITDERAQLSAAATRNRASVVFVHAYPAATQSHR